MTGEIPDEVRITSATPPQVAEVASIFDAAALQTDHEAIESAIRDGDVLVATASDDRTVPDDPSGPILGALLVDGQTITTIAVRPGRRGQGIGTALVAAVARRRNELIATFEASARPFWEAIGCDVERIPGTDRYRGRLDEPAMDLP